MKRGSVTSMKFRRVENTCMPRDRRMLRTEMEALVARQRARRDLDAVGTRVPATVIRHERVIWPGCGTRAGSTELLRPVGPHAFWA